MVQEADPDWAYKKGHYFIYEFANGRLFYNVVTAASKREIRDNTMEWS